MKRLFCRDLSCGVGDMDHASDQHHGSIRSAPTESSLFLVGHRGLGDLGIIFG
ncbi:hypothetical protein SORBI_3010G210050 [Sorghum bicolor]|uniref:Uncharacterized protein n=1 Tax=Sorghum bicolor TaxID=4558 RepID=A0A1W0VU46_SORBI|nr:hypothetical protein SORBI_3010G210050 [Sorghum bicolor]